MTVFNGALYLADTLQGLLAMDWPEYEIVVVDDGSTDASAEIITALAQDNPRIKLHQFGRLGRAPALNRGVAAASGDYVAINDADDYSLPHRLQVTVEILRRNPLISFAAGSHRVVLDDDWSKCDRSLRQAAPTGKHRLITCDQLYKRNCLVHSAVVFPKAIWSVAGGYNENLTSFVDYEFYFRLLAFGPAAHMEDVVVLYRRRFSTSFKERSAAEYVANYKAVLRTARQRCCVPLSCRIYDLKPYLMMAHRAWRRRHPQSRYWSGVGT